MSTPRSDSLAGIREQAPLERNVQLTKSLWHQSHGEEFAAFEVSPSFLSFIDIKCRSVNYVFI